MNDKKSKIIGIVIGIVIFITLLGGVTYAVFNWRSTDTNITATTKCFNIEGNSSYSVNGSNMLLFDESDILDTTNNTITYKNGMMYYPFNISRDSGCNIDIYYEIIVNVTTLSEDYRNDSLKYKIISDMSGYTSEQIANPLNENLEYESEGIINRTGKTIIYARDMNINTTKVQAVIFYIDGDLVPENASSLTFNATMEVVANPGVITAGDYITNLYEFSPKSTATLNSITYNLASSVGLMNDRLASMNTGADDGNIRYYGTNPDNYVWLGDTFDTDYTYTLNEKTITRPAGSKKLWRIIGVFDGRIKLVTADPISDTKLSWDTSVSDVNHGDGINQWGPSTYSTTGDPYEGADLMRLLNPGYENDSVNNSLYWTSGNGRCYNGQNNLTTSCNFTNVGLSDSEKALIDTVTWYLGAYNSSNAYYANVQYAAERQDILLGKSCSSSDHFLCTDEVERTATWTGKIGLIYGSDYAYATDLSLCNSWDYSSSSNSYSCRVNNWLFMGAGSIFYTISPVAYSVYATNVFRISSGMLTANYVYSASNVFPAIYLKENINIQSGSGTFDYPYLLS